MYELGQIFESVQTALITTGLLEFLEDKNKNDKEKNGQAGLNKNLLMLALIGFVIYQSRKK